MKGVELLRELSSRGVTLQLDQDGQLRYRAPQGVLTDGLKEELRKRKPEIVQLLQSNDRNPLHNSITAYSEKLNRRITISWASDDPKEVLVDDLPFNLDEIASMRQANPTGKDLERILMVKQAFGIKLD